MVCRNKCQRLGGVKSLPINRGSEYDYGYRYCSECALYFNHGTKFCGCCGITLRWKNRPHKGKTKRNALTVNLLDEQKAPKDRL